jgi:GAF domain-containing protein
LGVILIFRLEVKPFTDKQIALVETFADQAAIAIENVRLFDAVQLRTRNLTESLEQQTATAEVLKVISRSAFDLQTVLNTLIESAVRLCNASRGEVFVRGGDLFHIRAHAGRHLPGLLEFLRQNPIRTGRGTVTGRVAITGEVHNIADIVEDAEYEFPGVMEHRALRSRLGVPLVRDGRVDGVLHLSREESQPFTPRQVELVSTFADQAVIALENARLFNAVQERTRELTESLEQQTATAEVLKVISRSAFDLQTVLDTLIQSAVRLCNAHRGVVRLREGDMFVARASAGETLDAHEFLAAFPIRAGRETATGRLFMTGAVQNIADVTADPEYDFPGAREHHWHRAVLAVPLTRDGRVEGAVILTRQEPQAFQPRQVELLKTFADQAVIAIQNARLFDAVQKRTQELAQSVAELQALEEVLRAVNSSLDLHTVLSTIIGRAVPLAQADEGTIYEFDTAEEVFIPKAAFGMSEDRIVQLRERRVRIGETFLGRSALKRLPIHVADVQQDGSTPDAAALLPGIHAVLAIPLLRDDEVIGGLVIRRRREGAFDEATVKLLQTFATQSVLAIANARLFDEVQAKTRELTESLEIQSATADVLKAISRSAFDLDTVLDTLTRSAATLCGAATGLIHIREGEQFRVGAMFGHSPALTQFRQSTPTGPGRGSVSARAALSHAVEQVLDMQADPEIDPRLKATTTNRTALAVPLLRDDKLEGIFVLGRAHVEAFSQRQIELVQTFADQALIAIENARLFSEVQARTKELTESLEIQSATADVLKAISRSAFDLDSVLDTLTRSAANLCDAATGTMYIRESDIFRIGASSPLNPGIVQWRKGTPMRPGRGSLAARAALTHQVEHILDVQADSEIDPGMKAVTSNRTALAVPLLREDSLEGVFVLGRTRVEPFTQRQIELVETFADQALIAIENARLFNEVQARTRELTKSLDDLRTAQDRLIQTEKLASLGQLTAGIAHEIKNPLNFVNNFSALSVDLIDELHTALTPVPLDAAVRDEVMEVTDLLRGNLEKVVQHGKRADGIVKNMLLHARESGGERRSVDLNATVDEALNLAYHGARAEKPGFTITLERNFDPAVGTMELYPQEFTRVVLNIIANGFYAATRKARDAPGPDFQPTLTVTTEAHPNEVLIRVRDNGTGIPDNARARLFEPFFTTKPAGEGTGLGLSLSHDIIVKQHSGSIAVDSQLGEYTEFRISLPRTSAGAPT